MRSGLSPAPKHSCRAGESLHSLPVCLGAPWLGAPSQSCSEQHQDCACLAQRRHRISSVRR
ncbi:hypothetical protein NDU88_006869, partial [Pleurodeles waltl]